ncbi:MAG: helix-turn-helix domain-containing protein [Vibrio fluvialis]
MTNQALREHIDSLIKLRDELGIALNNKIVHIDTLVTDEEAKAIGKRLADARMYHHAHSGLSQRMLADFAGVDHSVISRMESGSRKHLNNIIQVGEAGRFSIYWLIFGEGFPIHEPIIAGSRYYAKIIEQHLMTLYDSGGVRPYDTYSEQIKEIENSLEKISEKLGSIVGFVKNQQLATKINK